MKKLLSAVLILLFSTTLLHAQSFSPDRPGIGNGSYITPKNMLGSEFGIQYSSNDLSDQVDIGQVVFRYGIAEKLELRALLNSYSSVSFDGPTDSNTGFQDMSIGAKYNLLSGGEQPNISALAELSLPVGSDAFTSDEAIPTIGLLADHSLNETWGISSNLGYTFEAGNLTDSWLFTLTPGFAFPNSENLGGYFGYAGKYFGNGLDQHWIEGGVAYGLVNGGQLDLNAGYDTEGETFFIGAGFAIGF